MRFSHRAGVLVSLVALTWTPASVLAADSQSQSGSALESRQPGHEHEGDEDPREALRDAVLERAPMPTEVTPGSVAEESRVLRDEAATDRAKLQAARWLAGSARAGDSSAMAALLAVLRDKDAGGARIFAAIALRDSKSSEAVGPLMEVLADRSVPSEIRRQAALSLGELGDPRARESLLAATADPVSADVRYYAYVALTLPGLSKLTPQAPLLLTVVKDQEQSQFRRSRAVLHLNKVGDATIVDPLIEILLKEPRSSDISPQQKGDVTAGMFLGVMNSQRNVRARIVAALGTHGDSRIVKPILKVMSTAADDPVFMKGAEKALAKVSRREGTAAFVAALKDPDPGVRRQAVFVLSEMDGVDKTSVLGPALADEDAGVRATAEAALKPEKPITAGGGNATTSEKK